MDKLAGFCSKPCAAPVLPIAWMWATVGLQPASGCFKHLHMEYAQAVLSASPGAGCAPGPGRPGWERGRVGPRALIPHTMIPHYLAAPQPSASRLEHMGRVGPKREEWGRRQGQIKSLIRWMFILKKIFNGLQPIQLNVWDPPPCPKLHAVCYAELLLFNYRHVQHVYPSKVLQSSSMEKKLAGSWSNSP